MFRIGEFAIIAQVSSRLLRYYDAIGLLSPLHTDPQTGYRYYSAEQLPRLNRILVLKGLGLSLDQIARLLDEQTSPEDLRGMLILRKAQLMQSLHDDLASLQTIEARLRQIEMPEATDELDVILKSVPSSQFLALHEVVPDIQGVRRLVSMLATSVPLRVPAGYLGQLVIVMHSPMVEPDGFEIDVGYLLEGHGPTQVMLPDERVLTQTQLSAVPTMATIIHAGRVQDSHQAYARLGIWAERYHWQISGPGRQVLLQLPSIGQDDGVFEIQLPVQHSTHTSGEAHEHPSTPLD